MKEVQDLDPYPYQLLVVAVVVVKRKSGLTKQEEDHLLQMEVAQAQLGLLQREGH